MKEFENSIIIFTPSPIQSFVSTKERQVLMCLAFMLSFISIIDSLKGDILKLSKLILRLKDL